jgi:hypothetical protein
MDALDEKEGVRVSVKLVVSGSSKESRIALVGRTGKELLTSATFTEPRAKGATLRALKKIFGSDVVVEDSTTNGRPAKAETDSATTATVTPRPRRPTTASAAKPATRKTTKRAAKTGQE